MVIGPLTEVILYVSDMERSVRFYRDMLGQTPISPQCTDYSKEFWVVLNTGPCKLCLHAGGTGNRGTDAPKIVFHVEDIHTCRDRLISNGISLDQVFSPVSGVFVCNGIDPDGNRFSLEANEVPDNS